MSAGASWSNSLAILVAVSWFRRGSGQEAQSLDSRKEQVGAATDCRERRDAGDLLPNRPLRDDHVERAVLRADDWIARVLLALEAAVVGPHAHHELELPNQAAASHEGRNSAI